MSFCQSIQSFTYMGISDQNFIPQYSTVNVCRSLIYSSIVKSSFISCYESSEKAFHAGSTASTLYNNYEPHSLKLFYKNSRIGIARFFLEEDSSKEITSFRNRKSCSYPFRYLSQFASDDLPKTKIKTEIILQ